jgi:hypothetical protein
MRTNMDFSEELLLGILGTIIAWLVTNIVMFFLKRYRLENAIISDITYHMLGVKEAKDYFIRLFQNTIKEGKPVEYA